MIAFLEAFWPFIALAGIGLAIYLLARRPKAHDVGSGGDYADPADMHRAGRRSGFDDVGGDSD